MDGAIGENLFAFGVGGTTWVISLGQEIPGKLAGPSTLTHFYTVQITELYALFPIESTGMVV